MTPEEFHEAVTERSILPRDGEVSFGTGSRLSLAGGVRYGHGGGAPPPRIPDDGWGGGDDDDDDDEFCRRCGEPSGGGDGWDGLCASCADREEEVIVVAEVYGPLPEGVTRNDILWAVAEDVGNHGYLVPRVRAYDVDAWDEEEIGMGPDEPGPGWVSATVIMGAEDLAQDGADPRPPIRKAMEDALGGGRLEAIMPGYELDIIRDL